MNERRQLTATWRRRRRARQAAASLKSLSVFSGCSPAELARLDGLGVRVRVGQGRRLVVAGERGGDFVVVLSGTATCAVGPRPVAQFGPGEFFGEVALLDGGPRTATVVADTDMEVLVLSVSEFEELLDACPSVAHQVLAALAQRLRAANDLALAPVA